MASEFCWCTINQTDSPVVVIGFSGSWLLSFVVNGIELGDSWRNEGAACGLILSNNTLGQLSSSTQARHTNPVGTLLSNRMYKTHMERANEWKDGNTQ
jgi:hypothetical protein